MNIKCGFVETAVGLPCRIDGWNLLEQGFKISFGCSRHITPEDQAKYSMLWETWLNGRNGKPQVEQRRGFDAGWIAGEKRGREKGAAEERERMAPLVEQIERELSVMEARLSRVLGGTPSERVERDLLVLTDRVGRM